VFLVLAVLFGLCGCRAKSDEPTENTTNSPKMWGIFEVIEEGTIPASRVWWQLLRYPETGQLYYYERRACFNEASIVIVPLENTVQP